MDELQEHFSKITAYEKKQLECGGVFPHVCRAESHDVIGGVEIWWSRIEVMFIPGTSGFVVFGLS